MAASVTNPKNGSAFSGSPPSLSATALVLLVELLSSSASCSSVPCANLTLRSQQAMKLSAIARFTSRTDSLSSSVASLTVSLYLAILLLPFIFAVACKTVLQSILNISDLTSKQGPVGLDLVYNTPDDSSSLFTPGTVSPSERSSLGAG